MIILHFHLQPQFKYGLLHIYFNPHGRYELNKLTSLPKCGFKTHLVEHRTGIAEVTGSNPVEALFLFSGFFLNSKNYCDDHASLSPLHSTLKNEATVPVDCEMNVSCRNPIGDTKGKKNRAMSHTYECRHI